MNPEISVIIPVYRSVETLKPLFDRIKTTLESHQQTFEVIFVLDGPQRESWQELLRIKKNAEGEVNLYQLSKNFGQNAATLCGINHANGELVVTMDDDLQTPPEEISKLLEHYYKCEVDVVFGTPIVRNRSRLRKLGASVGRVLFRAIDGADIGTAFRLIGPRVKSLLNSQNHNLFLNQIIHWYTVDIDTVEVLNTPRKNGKSGYSFIGLTLIMLRLVIFYTDFPLKLMTVFGSLTSLVCFALGGYYIWEKLTYGAEFGFTSIIVAIFFATGIILSAISVLGLYINRIYEDRSHKPVYAIKRKV